MRRSDANSSLCTTWGSRTQRSALQSQSIGTDTAPISAVVVTTVLGALLTVIRLVLPFTRVANRVKPLTKSSSSPLIPAILRRRDSMSSLFFMSGKPTEGWCLKLSKLLPSPGFEPGTSAMKTKESNHYATRPSQPVHKGSLNNDHLFFL